MRRTATSSPAFLRSIALAGVLLSSSLTHAQVSRDQGRCQAGAAKAALARLTSEARALSACRDAIGEGDLDVGSDCEAVAEAALAKAAATYGEALAKACADDAVASLRHAGACSGATTVAALADCLGNAAGEGARDLLATLYASASQPTPAARACREAASREARKYAAKAIAALHKCKNAASKGKLVARARCEDDAKVIAAIAKTRAKATAKVAGACGGVALADAAFGDSCASPADVETLFDCVDSSLDDVVAALAPAEYGDGGLCGDAHNAVEGRIDSLLLELSLVEKIRLMAGSGVIRSETGWPTPAIPRLALPGFSMIDGPRGVGKQSGSATAFPVGMARGASFDVDLERRVGDAIGRETRAKGASVILAPATTVVRHPRWGRAQESYGEDPFHLGEMGKAFVEGAQRHVLASVKHFALNSIEDTRYTVSVNVDERTLREIYLPHFEKVVTEGEVASVMAAYNRVNGLYCSENAHLLRDILKEEWGFRGFVESDWINGVYSTGPAALAGLDIEMPAPVWFTRALMEPLVQSGDVPEPVLDESVRRNLRAKFCFRLDDDPPRRDPSQVETAEHVALAREAAEKGTVLLKNEGALLPLGSAPTVAVVGPLADLVNLGDTGSSDVTPSSAVTLLEGLEAHGGAASVVHVTGDVTEPGNAAVVSGADVVVVAAGFTADDEGETFVGAGDRDTYALPTDQEQLILEVAALSDDVVVVLEGGSAIGVEAWVDEVEAVLHAWYPGMRGGEAIANLLFGDANPSAKLPLVVAADEADLPPFVNDQDEVAYGYWHGYRLLDHEGDTPRFPFGFGLSYTTFAYANLALEDDVLGGGDTLSVSFDVSNTGAVAGTEVAQLYVGYPNSAVERPVLDLRAFARVELDPGQTRRVTLEVEVADLAWYDDGGAGWTLEHVAHAVHVGSSSMDLPLSAAFSIEP